MSALLKKPAKAGDFVLVKFRGEEQFRGKTLKYDTPYKTAVLLDDGQQVVVETADQKWTVEVLEEAA